MNNNELQGANLSELMQNATELTTQQQAAETKPTELKENQAAPQRPELVDDDFIITPDENGGLAVQPAYDGPGIIIENQPEKPAEMPKYTGVSPETMNHVDRYMKEMDKEIEEKKKLAEEIEKKQKEQEMQDPEDVEKENEKNYNEAIVIIDKIGMGQIINFTEEEREKLEKVKKIRVEEVENVQLSTIKSKRAKKGSLPTILKRQKSALTTPIVLPASGYTAVLRGCSTYELVSLMGESGNRTIDTTAKWSLIHDKIVETSIGHMDFDTFLKETASIDYNNFIYGLLCSTYPDDDKIPLRCPKCEKEHEHAYSVRSLIRAEKMTDSFKSLIADIVDNSHCAENAQEAHKRAAVNTVKTVLLPHSGIIAELYVQSAFDLIYRTIKSLEENMDAKYNQASILSTAVKAAHIPDPDDPDQYLLYDDALDITQIIYSLKDSDLLVLTHQASQIMEDLTFTYGLMNVHCPNPKCRHFEPFIPFEIDTILFYRYQQAMNTKIE